MSQTPRDLASLAFRLVAGEDGTMLLKDFKAILERPKYLQMFKMFWDVDTDRNRLITEDEYLNQIMESTSPDINNASRAIASAGFHKIAGDDGQISMMELINALKGTGYEKDIYTIFSETDKDKSRSISEEEFLNAIFKLSTSVEVEQGQTKQ